MIRNKTEAEKKFKPPAGRIPITINTITNNPQPKSCNLLLFIPPLSQICHQKNLTTFVHC